MPNDFEHLSAHEKKIAKLIAALFWVPVADVAAAITDVERGRSAKRTLS